jgi:hypothetical protein
MAPDELAEWPRFFTLGGMTQRCARRLKPFTSDFIGGGINSGDQID